MHKGSPEINRKFWASLWLFSLVLQRWRGMWTVATCLRYRTMQPAARLIKTTIRQQPALTHWPDPLPHISSGQLRENDGNVMSSPPPTTCSICGCALEQLAPCDWPPGCWLWWPHTALYVNVHEMLIINMTMTWFYWLYPTYHVPVCMCLYSDSFQ